MEPETLTNYYVNILYDTSTSLLYESWAKKFLDHL